MKYANNYFNSSVYSLFLILKNSVPRSKPFTQPMYPLKHLPTTRHFAFLFMDNGDEYQAIYPIDSKSH